MAATPEPQLPIDLRAVLSGSFLIRTSVRGRRSDRLRITETTYVWRGGDAVYLSGYPGKRDWVANMAANPEVTLHTVEGHPWYDIPGRARVLRDREERLPHLFAFVDHWAARGGAMGWPFRSVMGAAKINRALHLPWWGPFWLLRRVLDRMPCVEIIFTEPPVERTLPPPAPSKSA